MSIGSKIEWTQCTWNPITGCTRISTGCQHCYAERMAHRLEAMGQQKYRNGFRVTVHENELDTPLHWHKPRRVFVNSMSDLFHEDVPPDFIQRVFSVMNAADRHVFQVLTKRSERLLGLNNDLYWSNNIWMGVTVEHQDCLHRVDDLRQADARIKWLSCEPLLSSLSGIDLTHIDWVVVGGESGPGARPIQREWVTDIRDRCQDAHVPFFFKQWGGVNKKTTGRTLDDRTWDEYPFNR